MELILWFLSSPNTDQDIRIWYCLPECCFERVQYYWANLQQIDRVNTRFSSSSNWYPPLIPDLPSVTWFSLQRRKRSSLWHPKILILLLLYQWNKSMLGSYLPTKVSWWLDYSQGFRTKKDCHQPGECKFCSNGLLLQLSWGNRVFVVDG